jgi:hypothetical protein
MNLESVPFDRGGGGGDPMSSPSSRLTLWRDVVDMRCEVKRGEFGIWLSDSVSSVFGSPSVSVCDTAGTGGGGSEDVSCVLLLIEDDRRLVKDLVLSMGDSRVSAISSVSWASSKVSYKEFEISNRLVT